MPSMSDADFHSAMETVGEDGYYFYKQRPQDRWTICYVHTQVKKTKTVRKVHHFHGGQDFLDRYPLETRWWKIVDPNTLGGP